MFRTITFFNAKRNVNVINATNESFVNSKSNFTYNQSFVEIINFIYIYFYRKNIDENERNGKCIGMILIWKSLGSDHKSETSKIHQSIQN